MRLRGIDGREWQQVRHFSRRWEAEMVQGFLESHGIPTWLPADDAGSTAYPNISLVGYPVLVPAEDRDSALDLLEAGVSPQEPFPGDAPGDDEPLVELLLALLALPCVAGDEGPIADWIEGRYRAAGEPVQRVGHSLVAGTIDPRRPTVLLVGHTDVVPPTDEDLPARVDGERIVGRGASDMKSGLAVGMVCFEDMRLREGPYNILLVAYAGEEGPHEGNELGPLLHAVPQLTEADFAIVLEPTDLRVQLGCLGTLHAHVAFTGQAAHSARPWQGENALTKAGGFLELLQRRSPVDVVCDGLVFREVVTATQAWTGPAQEQQNAPNVVPDRFTVNLNYRFAPDKTPEEAEARLRALVGSRADLVITDRAPAAPPRRGAATVEAFIAAAATAVEPKQAWTDVARFADVGVAALNYGPGLTDQAHQRGEYVPVENLRVARATLGSFLSGGAVPRPARG
jgi:succinyl-diaminopimelate desuccinylase